MSSLSLNSRIRILLVAVGLAVVVSTLWNMTFVQDNARQLNVVIPGDVLNTLQMWQHVTTTLHRPRKVSNITVQMLGSNGALVPHTLTIDHFVEEIPLPKTATQRRLIHERPWWGMMDYSRVLLDDEEDDDDLGLISESYQMLAKPTLTLVQRHLMLRGSNQGHRRIQGSSSNINNNNNLTTTSLIMRILLPAILVSIGTVIVACVILLVIVDWRNKCRRGATPSTRKTNQSATTPTGSRHNNPEPAAAAAMHANTSTIIMPPIPESVASLGSIIDYALSHEMNNGSPPLSPVSTMTNSVLDLDDIILNIADFGIDAPVIEKPMSTPQPREVAIEHPSNSEKRATTEDPEMPVTPHKTTMLYGEMVLQTPHKRHVPLFYSPSPTTPPMEGRDSMESRRTADISVENRQVEPLAQLEYILSSIPTTPIRVEPCQQSTVVVSAGAIGWEVRATDTFPRIVSLPEDLVDWIHPGDSLVRINDIDAKGMSQLQILGCLAGNRPIKLTVLAAGSGEDSIAEPMVAADLGWPGSAVEI